MGPFLYTLYSLGENKHWKIFFTAKIIVSIDTYYVIRIWIYEVDVHSTLHGFLLSR